MLLGYIHWERDKREDTEDGKRALQYWQLSKDVRCDFYLARAYLPHNKNKCEMHFTRAYKNCLNKQYFKYKLDRYSHLYMLGYMLKNKCPGVTYNPTLAIEYYKKVAKKRALFITI